MKYTLLCCIVIVKTNAVDKELIINSTPVEVEIALLENKKLAELHRQKTNSNFTVGDIFLGKTRKLIPGLNAAFIDIGYKKDAFLHYTDLGPKLRSLLKFTKGAMSGGMKEYRLDNFKIESEIIKTGKIDQVLDKKESILVQVLKEPISTKGPRLSCEITIPGRYVVLTPFTNVVAVSKKVSNNDERKRLQRLVESIRPKNFGVIVRTAAEGKGVADIHEEILSLLGKWGQIHSQLHNAKAPKKLLSELDKTSSILRDILTESFNKIIVNDKQLSDNIKTYLKQIAPEQVGIVNYYGGKKPVFDNFGITKQIKGSFGKTATMSSGAYIVIEHTEAMHVIDVNSGHKISNSIDQESNAIAVNLESAGEIARQLRLRDIGGLIIIDFIDVKKQENKKLLYQKMREFMKKDRAQHTVLPLSKFGLMQITRQRVKPELNISTTEKCPTCKGTGKISPSILLTDKLEADVEAIINSIVPKKLTLEVHPYIYGYLNQGVPSQQMRWSWKHKQWIRLKSNSNLAIMSYHFYDEHDDEIRQ